MKFLKTHKSLVFIILILLPMLTSCGPLKYKKVDAKEVATDPKERLKKISRKEGVLD